MNRITKYTNLICFQYFGASHWNFQHLYDKRWRYTRKWKSIFEKIGREIGNPLGNPLGLYLKRSIALESVLSTSLRTFWLHPLTSSNLPTDSTKYLFNKFATSASSKTIWSRGRQTCGRRPQAASSLSGRSRSVSKRSLLFRTQFTNKSRENFAWNTNSC